MSLNPLETPLNTLFALSIAYNLFRIAWPSTSRPTKLPGDHSEAYNWLPEKHPEASVFKHYTPKTLEKFDGKDGGKILLAIDRHVFDVSNGRNFYGPDGMYGNFAGRDASRGMAKQSFDVEMLTPIDQPIDKLEDLNPGEIDNMNSWVGHFKYKYITVGKLVENDDI